MSSHAAAVASASSSSSSSTVLSSEEAVRLLLDSNFDVDSKECILTLLKIIDNILSKPSNPKVRTLRKNNPTVRRKVFDRTGGLGVLLSIGFTFVYPILPVRMGIGTRMEMDQDDDNDSPSSSSKPEAEAIVLEMGTEDMEAIASLRTLLNRTLRKDLGVAQRDVPPPPRQPQRVTPATSPAVVQPFDPFQSHSYNAQAAALGAPNPTSIRPDGSTKRSDTEVRLEELEGRRKKMERDVQRGGGNGTMALCDRGIVACRPGDSSSISGGEGSLPTISNSSSSTGGRTSGDSSLIARQLTRKAEERKQREDGGFTTSAMRALTKLKKAKIYTHARLKICFPDGSSLSASFLPKETIAVVMEVIDGCLVGGGGQGRREFEVYVTPPRRKLEGIRTLEAEGLVPAAKVFVSWKGDGGGTFDGGVGTFMKRELFDLVDAPVVVDSSGSGDISSFPQSRPLVGRGDAAKNVAVESGGGGGVAKKPSREEEMMQRMLGRGSGLGGRKLGGGKRKPGGKISGKKSK